MHLKIACVVVTYNRKELLVQCLDSILKQEYKPHTVYIIDNASLDGTPNLIAELGYDNTIKDSIRFIYKRLDKNIGGAGGFYEGIKTAYESLEIFDGVWVMDDDGIADNKQLKNLVSYIGIYDYISPLVVCKENNSKLAFLTKESLDISTKDKYGNYVGLANPFNGILYSRKLIETIGYPKKELFIWGDEVNYDIRAKLANFTPVIISTAVHYHPLDRQVKVKTLGNRFIAVPNEDWKLYCLIRNRVYNSKLYNSRYKLLKRVLAEFIDYSYYLIKTNSINRIKVVLVAINDALIEDFSNSMKFLK